MSRGFLQRLAEISPRGSASGRFRFEISEISHGAGGQIALCSPKTRFDWDHRFCNELRTEILLKLENARITLNFDIKYLR